jgi:hypothetical protein
VTAVQGLALLVGAAAVGFILWNYFRREVPVGGRWLLASVRALTLALIVLLLLDPSVPAPPRATGGAATWVALDASLSMAVAAEGEASPWDRARERALELQRRGNTLAAFGDGLRFAAEDPALLEGGPWAGATQLAPLLERALEAGAGEVIVLSDLRFADPVAVRGLLESGGLSVRFEDVGASTPDAGVSRFELPAALSSESASFAQLGVHASESAAGRTATVEVYEADRLVFSRDVVLAEPGLVVDVPVELPPPQARGAVRYEARVRLAQDAFPGDDARVSYGTVDPEEGLLVAVSLVPDWELRFLLPVLEQVTGLSTRGYVRLTGDRYLATGGAAPPQGLVDAEEVRRRLGSAELVVLQGLSRGDPEWLREAATAARRVVVLPADASGAEALGISARAPLGGEWYVSPEIPPSPLTSDLAGATWQGLPPLGGLLPVTGGEESAPALRVQLGGDGSEESVLVLQSDESGRRAVVLASGFWRWAFRAGEPRASYRRLWAGVAGWLLDDPGLGGSAALRPEKRVVAREDLVRWAAPGLAGQQVTLQLTRGDSVVLDTVLTPPAEGVLQTDALPPGTYRYRASWTAPEAGSAEGAFDVEAYTDELRHAPARDLLEASTSEGGAAGGRGMVSSRRPLRTHPAPYLLLLGLLCGEWVVRRRKGLR